jgi:hypothetical protein
VDNVAATGRGESDEEEEPLPKETFEHDDDDEEEEEEEEEYPEDTEGRHTSQARLRDAFEQDERAGFWGSLLERATARSQSLRRGRDSEDETVEEDEFTWKEGDGLWEIGCRVRVLISVLLRVLNNIVDRT